MGWVGLAVALVGAADAACFARSTSAQVAALLEDAESAYVSLDAERFGRAMDEATLELPCVADVLPPPVVARFHRLSALRLYAAGESDRALDALRALKATEPGFRFPDEVLPPDHELRLTYEDLAPATGSERPAQPRHGELVFDGLPSARRPAGRATVVQLSDGGVVAFTAPLGSSDPLPDFLARPRARDRWLLASAGALAFAGASYAVAWAWNGAFWEDESDLPEGARKDAGDLQRIQAASVTWTALAGVSLGLSATGVTLAVVADRRHR